MILVNLLFMELLCYLCCIIKCGWILGSISDQYQYVVKGRIRNRRKVLLGLLISVYALLAVCIVLFVVSIASAIVSGPISATASTAVPVLGALGLYLVAWVLSVVAMVFTYIAYYDLFASANPSNAVLFLVLSIFFNFLLPFFVFACRKKDEGMPPRKVQVATEPAADAAEPVLELQPAEEPEMADPAEEVSSEAADVIASEEDFEA